ncbi:MAG: iron ABC transporter permease [Thaumarchaeota archaeon]|nr:MAG: iron ABC transporter permease [Nitrososphaerota archaeon]
MKEKLQETVKIRLEGYRLLRKRLLKWRAILTYLIIGLCLTIIATTAIGPVYIPPAEIISIISYKLGFNIGGFNETHMKIILQLRLPRIFLGIFVGMALSVAGVIMQGLFRNPLAGPYVLGVSSGAALGAALSIALLPAIVGIYTTPLAAFMGGLMAIFLVYNIVKLCGRFTVGSLLLAGIAIAYLFSAILSILIWTLSRDSHIILLWIMGGLWGADWFKVGVIAPIILLSTFMAFIFSRDLNALLLGEETAHSIGVNVRFIEKILPILASLITSAAVSFSGAIGFVGLMIPHIMRMLVGPDHRILIPSSALAGGIFLVWADAAARCLMELPVGVVTALAGTPFFIYLLRRRNP